MLPKAVTSHTQAFTTVAEANKKPQQAISGNIKILTAIKHYMEESNHE